MDKSSGESSWQCYSFEADSEFVNCTEEESGETSRRDFRSQNKELETKRHLERDTAEVKRGVWGRLQASPIRD